MADANDWSPAVTRETTPRRRRVRKMVLAPHPLTRPSDRLEVLARVVLLALLLGSLPIAVAVALTTYSSTHRQAAVQAVAWHPARATLLGEAPVADDGTGEGSTTSQAPAVWTTASGTSQKGSVLVTAGTPAGSTVHIWVDSAGHITPPPLTDSDAVTRAVGRAVLTVLLVTIGAFAAFGAARRAVDRSRARWWASEWADVEPLWTRHFS